VLIPSCNGSPHSVFGRKYAVINFVIVHCSVFITDHIRLHLKFALLTAGPTKMSSGMYHFVLCNECVTGSKTVFTELAEAVFRKVF
jgi:hypothetical protein